MLAILHTPGAENYIEWNDFVRNDKTAGITS